MPLKFKQELVAKGLTEFVAQNPNADSEAVNRKRDELIIRESVYALWIEHHNRHNTDGKSAEVFEAELRQGKNLGAQKAIIYFTEKDAPLWSDYLERFQTMAENDASGNVLRDFERTVYPTFHLASASKTLFSLTEQGDEYVRGLFAPVTDPSGMLFDALRESNLVTLKELRDKQAESDAIRIDVPKGMSEDLISYVVMGEFFKDKHLAGMGKYLYSRGSTILPVYSIATGTIATFFENTIISEERPNMHACRLLVPEVRQAAREIVESGNQAEINANLKNAFDILYNRAASMSDITKTAYHFTVRQADKLVKSLRDSGIDPAAVGITEAQLTGLSAMKKTVDFMTETERLRLRIQDGMEEFYFSGFAPEKDIANDPMKQEMLLQLSARKDIALGMAYDLVALHGLYEMYSYANADSHMAKRGPTAMEARLMADEVGVVTESLQYVQGSELPAKMAEMMKTPLKRMELMLNGIPQDHRHLESPLPTFFAEIQDDTLAFLDRYVAAHPDARELSRAVADVKKASAAVNVESSWEEYTTLYPPYAALKVAAEQYLQTLTPQQLQEPDHARLTSIGIAVNGLRDAVKDEPRRVAAQAEHNRTRAALHESVKNDALKYDHAKAQEKILAYRNAHTDADAEELRKGEMEIIAEEAMIYARLSAYERISPDGKDVLNFRRMENTLRSHMGTFGADMEAAERLHGEERLRFAAGYQKNYANAKNEKDLTLLSNMISYVNANYAYTNDAHSDGVFKALFAPKTDHSDIRMDHFDDGGLAKKADIVRWQSEIDSIEIPVPTDLHPSLVSFLVLGRTTQQDLLLKASYQAIGNGSTLPKDYRRESNVLVSLWDNLMIDDERGNMHCIRSVVPEARQAVKDMLLRGDQDAVKDNLRNAFDVMYNQIIIQEKHNAHTWMIPMKKLGELMDGLEKSGISPQSLGIDQEKLDKYNALRPAYDTMRELEQVELAVADSMYRYFESGFDPAFDPTGNNATRTLLERKAALSQAAHDFQAEMNNLKSDYGFMGLNYVDDVTQIRDLTPHEKLCAEDPEAFRELMLRQAHRSFSDKLAEAGNSPELKMLMMEKGLKADESIIPNQAERERTVVSLQLERMQGFLNKSMFNDLPGINEARHELDELLTFRMGNEYPLERMETFVKPYRHMSKTLLELYYALPDELSLTQEGLFMESTGNTLNTYIKGIQDEGKRLSRAEAEAKEFAELKRGLRPSFMERYESYRTTMAELGAGSEHPEDYNRMLRSMDALTDKLSTLCGEGKRNTVLSRSDARELRSLYVNALKRCTDYVNLRGKSSLRSDRVFMATELQSLLAQNLRTFDKLPEGRELTLSDALRSRFGEKVSVEDALSRFTAAADALEQVSSAFGGNSEEFQKMKEALDAFRGQDIDRKKLMELSETLAQRTENYITAKKVIPSTEQGKRRLQLARQFRELCNELHLADSMEYFGRKEDTRSYEQRLDDWLQNREAATINGMKSSVQSHNRELYSSQLSELLYLRDVRHRAELSHTDAAEMLKGAEMQQGVAKIRVDVDRMLASVSPKELGQAMNSPNPASGFERVFTSFKAVSAMSKGGSAADRADSLLTFNHPGLKL